MICHDAYFFILDIFVFLELHLITFLIMFYWILVFDPAYMNLAEELASVRNVDNMEWIISKRYQPLGHTIFLS